MVHFTKMAALFTGLASAAPRSECEGLDRIVGGQEIHNNDKQNSPSPFDAEWIVSLGILDEDLVLLGYICGGTWIGPEHILTAAHCFDDYNPNGLSTIPLNRGITTFAVDTKNEKGERAELATFRGADVTIHPGYGGKCKKCKKCSCVHDIAIIRIPKYHQNIKQHAVIGLPEAGETQNFLVYWAYGWGRTDTVEHKIYNKNNMESNPDILHWVKTQAVNFTTCDTTQHLKQKRFEDSWIICAGTEGISTCVGDSGGPLVQYGADCGAVQWGVTSWSAGLKCATKDGPTVYTNTANYIDWINEVQSMDCATQNCNGRGTCDENVCYCNAFTPTATEILDPFSETCDTVACASPCLNGGMCTNVNDKPSCDCGSAAFTSTATEILDPFSETCATVPCDSKCLNGGKCTNVNNKPSCDCGSENQIFGGQEINNQKEWMVPIYALDKSDEESHLCDGTWIDKDLILTAAHCFDKTPDLLRVYKKNKNKHDFLSAHVTIHPGYQGCESSCVHDIAIIRISGWSEQHDVINLPEAGETQNFTSFGAFGWGRTDTIMNDKLKDSQKYISSPDILHLVETVGFQTCDTHPQYLTQKGFEQGWIICAGTEGNSTCTGGTGGPLFQYGADCGAVQWGVTSWDMSPKCAKKNRPTIYTNTANYIKWIDEVRSMNYTTQTCNGRGTFSGNACKCDLKPNNKVIIDPFSKTCATVACDSPCENGGMCTNVKNKPTCECLIREYYGIGKHASFYEGDFCQVIKYNKLIKTAVELGRLLKANTDNDNNFRDFSWSDGVDSIYNMASATSFADMNTEKETLKKLIGASSSTSD